MLLKWEMTIFCVKITSLLGPPFRAYALDRSSSSCSEVPVSQT